MNEVPDFKWKVYYPDKKIYLSREHNWAFAGWEIAKRNKIISQNSLLIHLDAHLDDVPDGVNVNGLFEMETFEDVMKVAEAHDFSTGQITPNNMMRIDNFIWAGIATKTIGETIFVSHDPQEPNTLEKLKMIEMRNIDGEISSMEGKIILEKLNGINYIQNFRFNDVFELVKHFNKDAFNRYVENRSVILDLDLDFFNKSGSGYSTDFYPEHIIREQLKLIKDFYNWDLITVAISPSYCGYKGEWRWLLRIFMEEFALTNEDPQEW